MTEMGLVFEKHEWSLNRDFLECIHYEDDGCGLDFTDDCCISPNYIDCEKIELNDDDLAVPGTAHFMHQRPDGNHRDLHKSSHSRPGKKREWDGGIHEIPHHSKSPQVQRGGLPASNTGANSRHSLQAANGCTAEPLERCWLDCKPEAMDGSMANGRGVNAQLAW